MSTHWEPELNLIKHLAPELFRVTSAAGVDLPPMLWTPDEATGIRAHSPVALRAQAASHRQAADRARSELDLDARGTTAAEVYRSAAIEQAFLSRRHQMLDKVVQVVDDVLDRLTGSTSGLEPIRDAAAAFVVVESGLRSVIRQLERPLIARKPAWEKLVDGPAFTRPAPAADEPAFLAAWVEATLSDVDPSRTPRSRLGRLPGDFVQGHMVATVRGLRSLAEAELQSVSEAGIRATEVARVSSHCDRSERQALQYEATADAITQAWRALYLSDDPKLKSKLALLHDDISLGAGFEDYIHQVSSTAAEAAVALADPQWRGSSGRGFV